MSRFRTSNFGFRICLLTACFVLAGSGVSAKPLTAQEIIKRAADEYDRVQDYTTDLKVSVSSPNVHVPEMNIRVYYKKPDKLHVDSKEGFAVLPKQGVAIGNPLREMLKNSEVSLAGSERVLQRDCHLIRLTVKKDGMTTRSRVWIDKERHVVVQMFADPNSGPSLRLTVWYARVAGKYWLPSKSLAVVEFPAVGADSGKRKSEPSKPTRITAEFTNYKVNTGLSDSPFCKKRSN